LKKALGERAKESAIIFLDLLKIAKKIKGLSIIIVKSSHSFYLN